MKGSKHSSGSTSSCRRVAALSCSPQHSAAGNTSQGSRPHLPCPFCWPSSALDYVRALLCWYWHWVSSELPGWSPGAQCHIGTLLPRLGKNTRSLLHKTHVSQVICCESVHRSSSLLPPLPPLPRTRNSPVLFPPIRWMWMQPRQEKYAESLYGSWDTCLGLWKAH